MKEQIELQKAASVKRQSRSRRLRRAILLAFVSAAPISSAQSPLGVDPAKIANPVSPGEGQAGVAGGEAELGHSTATSGVEVHTPADLRHPQQALISSGYARTQGFAFPGDGGGGDWRWQATSSAVDNSCTVIKPNARYGAGRWLLDLTNGANAKQCGAQCNGHSDDTASLSTLLTASPIVRLPAGSVCIAENLVVTGPTILDLNGARLSAGRGAAWLVKGVGYAPQIKNGQLDDPNNNTLVRTNLSATANPGATSITVGSASRLAAGNFILLTLNSGARFPTKIISANGALIELQDAVPASATAARVERGGSGYAVNDVLIVKGGYGPPTTLLVTGISIGAITGLKVLVPGLYATAPDPAVPVTGGSGVGATVTLSTSGASSGALVQSARGLLVLDQFNFAKIADLRIINAPGAIEVKDTGTGVAPSFHTTEGTLENIHANTLSLFGIYRDIDTSVVTYKDITLDGSFRSPQFGAVGIYLNGINPGPVASGGDFYRGINLLQWENSFVIRGAQTPNFTDTVSDTFRNYGWIIDSGSDKVTFGGMWWSSFSGPQSLSGLGNQGVGVWVGNGSTYATAERLTAQNNAINLIDPGYVLRTNSETILSGSTSGAVPAKSTVFLGPSGAGVDGGGWLVPRQQCFVQGFEASSAAAPGPGQAFTYSLLDNSKPVMTGSITGSTSFSTGLVTGETFVNVGDTLAIELNTSDTATDTTHRYLVRLRC